LAGFRPIRPGDRYPNFLGGRRLSAEDRGKQQQGRWRMKTAFKGVIHGKRIEITASSCGTISFVVLLLSVFE
jgi:hypothetical protein